MKNTLSILFAIFGCTFILSAQAPPPPPPPPPMTGDTAMGAQNKAGDKNVYAYAEQMPQFPGGEDAFMAYLKTNIRYPSEERVNNKQGTIIVQFVVEKDGAVTNPRVVKEVPGAPGLSAEALRVISVMPKWSPGKIGGKPVRVYVTQPISFVLQGADPATNTPVCSRVLPSAEKIIDYDPGRAPAFEGGDSAMQVYLLKAFLEHKKEFKEMSGKTITVEFVIDKDGQVSNLAILSYRGTPEKIGRMGAQILCDMPKWIPGGNGIIGKPGSLTSNIMMRGSLYFGEYKGKKVKVNPRLRLQELPPPPPPKAPGIQPKQPPMNINVEPSFQGGDSALAKFLNDHLVYPAEAKKAGRQGTVIIGFIVGQDGMVSYPWVVQEVEGAPELTQEALRLVNSMPPWEPGSIKGVTARMPVKLPIKFVL